MLPHVWSYWFFPIASALLSAWVRAVFPNQLGTISPR